MSHTREPRAGSHAASSRTSEGGYTFIEALLHLAILSVFFILFAGFFRYSAGLFHHVGDPTSVEWELFRYEVTEYMKNVDRVEILERGSKLHIFSGETVTEIGYYPESSLIRKRVNSKGHEPMLTGVRSVLFTVSDNVLSIRAAFDDGTERGTMHHLLPAEE
ncbi:Competence protein ComGF [Bhargavaea cecembensis DSE10]|uniref:Competence protein ComGF n=1 Tax=Bhargavaea cecembensis DSE10 TaxID=1235279 RepID=M7NDL2_9BACL|nr:competence type IV pilus minor pilin ComGF [Bhargavaea cecembensis]EMR06658.1 Competence protein ComGF [Bhargavaea cecembensis DSE10]